MPLRVLHLEDDPRDHELVRATLATDGLDCAIVHVTSRDSYVAALAGEAFDLILADYKLPSFDGIAALELAAQRCPMVPFIFVSGTIGEETAIDTLKLGATDYVLKHRLARLAPALRRALGEADERARRLQAEEELRDYAQRLQDLSSLLLGAQEAERSHIARELHDEIGQALTALKINLQTIQRVTGDGPAGPQLADSVAIVDQAIQQVRSLLVDLRPPLLDELGLVAALRWFLERQVQRTGWDLRFQPGDVEERLPEDLEITCWRVVQEALTNVARHARAHLVHVRLLWQPGSLELQVQDDGVGFDVRAAGRRTEHSTGLGLLGMQERVRQAGGQLVIESGTGQGTAIRACFPLVDGPTEVKA